MSDEGIMPWRKLMSWQDGEAEGSGTEDRLLCGRHGIVFAAISQDDPPSPFFIYRPPLNLLQC
ncbi:hypothetical protein M422DRAFT_25878 [Sphaerobolus stellatus SS14]|nr:hypothetical protein M422DRAFT_25878 [Sphaerobolus stellatus SS14]